MIVIKTKYSLEMYKDFSWFCLFRGKYYRYGKSAFPIATGLAVCLAVYSFIRHSTLFLCAISTIAATICILFYLYAFMRPKAYVKRSPALFPSTVEFTFDDADFSILQAGDVTIGSSKTRYEALLKAYETKNAFYLFLTPRQAHLLTKKDFIKGTPVELRSLLQSKLPQGKFVLCR